VVAALVSSLTQTPTPADGLFLGEVGLGGEVRPVGGTDRRLAEAAQHGFRRCFASSRVAGGPQVMDLVRLDRVDDLVRALAA
jgi:DNA repair protein RadA/Sms